MEKSEIANKKMMRHVGSVSSATLVSRILGYARDALVASAFGGSHLTDAFYAAFRLPNLFRRIFGEGPMTAAFVPVFTEHLAKNKREDAEKFFQTMFTTLFAILSALVVLGIVFAPAMTHMVAWGFKSSDPAKFEQTVHLTRLMFPFLLFVCMAALTSGALNSMGRFFLPALAPAMLSVAEIGFVLLLMGLFSNPLEGLAVSAVVGGILHFGLLLPALRREKFHLKWQWNPFHPDVRRVGKAILPAVWGLSVDQINAFVNTICASFLVAGSVTALYNSNRLMQFPLALFGIATSIAALPSLSLYAAKEDWQGMKQTLNFALRMVFYTILPATVGLVVLGEPIIQLLFEHGKFTHRETVLTNGALVFYSLGLPAYAGVKVVVSFFYALKDTKTPVRVASYCLLINMVGNVSLMWRWGVSGLALASTISSLVNMLVLLWMLRGRVGLLGGRSLTISFLKCLGASAAMAAVSWGLIHFLHGPLLARVPVSVIAGAVVYLAITRVLGMEEFQHIKHVVMRSKTQLTDDAGQ